MGFKSMYTPSALLAIAFLALAVAIAIWDLYVTAAGHDSDTVTAIIGRWAAAFPVIPFAVGVLAGHLFWPRQPTILP